MDTTPNLSLPYIMPSQAQKHVTHNEALAILDALVQLTALDRDLTTPPANAIDGSCYIVPSGATGVWAGQAGTVAIRQDGDWLYLAPKRGWRAFVVDETRLIYWNGSAWQDGPPPTELQNMTRVGIGTAADATNPFSAKLNKVLWTAKTVVEGGDGDLRNTMNKESLSDVLSLLMQSGWSGRAEIGLIGDNDFTIRVSADGTTWTEVFRAASATGEVVIGNTRVGRDMLQNVLPDSGRFNGNANNTQYSGITYSAPTYLSPVGTGSFVAHAKFINDNNDYSGVGGALNAEVKELVDKIRPSTARRFGPEWYVMKVAQATAGLQVTQLFGGVMHGIVIANATAAMPSKFSIGYYVKVKTGSLAILVNSAKVNRAAIDGAAVPAGTGASPVMLTSASGWKHVNLEISLGTGNYDNTLFQAYASVSTEIYFALPKLVIGHVNLDPNLGILTNGKIFG